MSQSEPSVLEAAIVKTVAWFSLFDYPLTVFEIWKWLGVKSSLVEVEKTLRESVWLRGRLEFKDGFYVLGGRPIETLISIRQERFLDAARKFKKLQRAVRYFSLFPFVRAVFACNTLAWRHTTPESDIDLFIVVAPGTIWLSRFLLVTPFALFKKRPVHHSTTPSLHNSTTSDPFCFSFFVTIDNLSMDKLRLTDGDPYMSYWLASLVPVLDRGGVQDRLVENNKWAFEFLPNVGKTIKPPILLRWASKDTVVVFMNQFIFLKNIDKFVKFLQIKFLPQQIKDAANLDSRVVVSDSMLKFHLNDRRAKFRDDWKKLYEAYGAG